MEQHFPRKGPLVELKIVPVSVIQESSTPALQESQKLQVTFHKFLFWLELLLLAMQNTFTITEQINN